MELSIIIVDDDHEASRMIGSITAMKLPEATINIAENGKQGLELFKEHQPDIVITDIRMPVMDGIQMAREIKSIKDDTHFIVMTAYNDKETLAELGEIGVYDYMTKPIDIDKLLAGLEKCVLEITQGRFAKKIPITSKLLMDAPGQMQRISSWPLIELSVVFGKTSPVETQSPERVK